MIFRFGKHRMNRFYFLSKGLILRFGKYIINPYFVYFFVRGGGIEFTYVSELIYFIFPLSAKLGELSFYRI